MEQGAVVQKKPWGCLYVVGCMLGLLLGFLLRDYGQGYRQEGIEIIGALLIYGTLLLSVVLPVLMRRGLLAGRPALFLCVVPALFFFATFTTGLTRSRALSNRSASIGLLRGAAGYVHSYPDAAAWENRREDFLEMQRMPGQKSVLADGTTEYRFQASQYTFTLRVLPFEEGKPPQSSCVAITMGGPGAGKRNFYIGSDSILRFTDDGSIPTAKSPICW